MTHWSGRANRGARIASRCTGPSSGVLRSCVTEKADQGRLGMKEASWAAAAVVSFSLCVGDLVPVHAQQGTASAHRAESDSVIWRSAAFAQRSMTERWRAPECLCCLGVCSFKTVWWLTQRKTCSTCNPPSWGQAPAGERQSPRPSFGGRACIESWDRSERLFRRTENWLRSTSSEHRKFSFA
jgi:hypothetical protein